MNREFVFTENKITSDGRRVIRTEYNINAEIDKLEFIKFDCQNSIVTLKGYDNIKFRGRSELLILKGDKIYLSKSQHGLCSTDTFTYDVPGGSWEPNEDFAISAMREAEEEAYLVVDKPVYLGDYIVIYDKPKQWVTEKVPKKYWWTAYYTKVYVANYVKPYKGEVDDIDKDDIVDTGKFYPLRDVIDLLNPTHQLLRNNINGISLNK